MLDLLVLPGMSDNLLGLLHQSDLLDKLLEHHLWATLPTWDLVVDFLDLLDSMPGLGLPLVPLVMEDRLDQLVQKEQKGTITDTAAKFGITFFHNQFLFMQIIFISGRSYD